MELTILGASGTWPSPDTATSGYLVRHEGFNLWLDAGIGTFANLQRYIEPGSIDAVLVSHEHPDHMADLYSCFYARYYGGLGAPGLPLFASPGYEDHVGALLSAESKSSLLEAFKFVPVRPGEDFDVGPFRVRTAAMEHLGLLALGFRIDADAASLAYTGDTGPTKHVVEMARDADVLLAEATYQDGDELQPFHLSSRQAAEHARDAGVGTLVLTHILPTHDKHVSREQAAEAFGGPIALAVEGLQLKVGA